MTRNPRVVAVCGSLNDDSKTRIALRTALDAAAAAGATTELVDLCEYELPPYGWDGTSAGDAESLRRSVREADTVLLGTPVYHGSYSGALKNALDYCKRDDFDGTTVGMLAVAGGSFPRGALKHLRAVALELNAWPLPHRVAIPNSGSTVGDSEITDRDIADRIRQLDEEAARYAGVDRYPDVATAAEPPTVD